MHQVNEKRPRVPKVDDDVLRSQRSVVLYLFLSTLLMCVVATVALFAEVNESGSGGKEDSTPVILFVMVAGALGSFVSALNRIYASNNFFPTPHHQRLLRGANASLLVYSLIPPLVGAIGAVVLYLMFASSMLRGALFPEFHCVGTCDQFVLFVAEWRPKGAESYAKCLVWGFAAGFSERFVPDILCRLTREAEEPPAEKDGEQAVVSPVTPLR